MWPSVFIQSSQLFIYSYLFTTIGTYFLLGTCSKSCYILFESSKTDSITRQVHFNCLRLSLPPGERHQHQGVTAKGLGPRSQLVVQFQLEGAG